MSGEMAIAWPPLPETGFVSGRAATIDDVDRGKAVFCQQATNGSAAIPLQIPIPQYGRWTDQEGRTHSVIVVQAERHVVDHAGEAVLGLRLIAGGEVVATKSEVQLLGLEKPVD